MRIILFLIGFLLSIIGSIYIIIYLSYLSIGYSFINYLKFIMSKVECLIMLIGIILINISIFMKGEKHVLCL